MENDVEDTDAAAVSLRGIRKAFPGNEALALETVDLDIEAGSFFSILGPSGCGKTTLLRIVAGFEYPTEGRVYIGGRDVTSLSPRDRDIAMVFQDYALYPHMTVAQNIAFNLRNRKLPKEEIERQVQDVAQSLGMERLLRKKPGQLSGGERQRVALGRALVRKPRVFLLDEPLSNLDLKLREQMRIELGRIHQELGITTLYVTHDQAEALTLSTRLAVMRSGRVQQVGAPDVVYASPANTFVGRFIGSPSMNVFHMVRDGGQLRAVDDAESRLPLPAVGIPADGEEVYVGLRPHELHESPDGVGIRVAVGFSEHLGRANFVVCGPTTGGAYLHEQDAIQFETPTTVAYDPDVRLALTAHPSSLRVFSLDGRSVTEAPEPAGVRP